MQKKIITISLALADRVFGSHWLRSRCVGFREGQHYPLSWRLRVTSYLFSELASWKVSHLDRYFPMFPFVLRPFSFTFRSKSLFKICEELDGSHSSENLELPGTYRRTTEEPSKNLKNFPWKVNERFSILKSSSGSLTKSIQMISV